MTPSDTQTALTSSALSSLFNIPETDWTAISKRVGMACMAKGIESELGIYLPGFPPLVDASVTWRDSTFPGVVAQAQALAAYSQRARQLFGELSADLDAAQLDPTAPLPPPLAMQFQAAVDGVRGQSQQLGQSFAGLSDAVAAFTQANQAADAQIDAYVKRFPGWAPLLGETKTVDSAVEQVLGAWRALDADLQAAIPGDIPVTMEVIARLGVDAALLTWQDLQQEAAAFPALARGQEVYLSGQWLTQPAGA